MKIEINVVKWNKGEDGSEQSYRQIVDTMDIRDIAEVLEPDHALVTARVTMKTGKKFLVKDDYESLREKFLGDNLGNTKW